MIKEKDAEAAVEYIKINAKHLAKAKSDRIYLEQFRKTKKALLMNETEGSDKTREAYAYAHPEYKEVLDGLREAVRQEESIKWKMVAAQQKIEVWRTQQANNRSLDNAVR